MDIRSDKGIARLAGFVRGIDMDVCAVTLDYPTAHDAVGAINRVMPAASTRRPPP